MRRHELTHEVVVPGHLSRHHEEAKEPIGQEHLDPLVVRGQVALGVVALVCVLPAPLISTGSQLVGSQGTGARGEAKAKKRWNPMTKLTIYLNQFLTQKLFQIS